VNPRSNPTPGPLIVGFVLLAGLSTLAIGGWAFLTPRSFAQFIDFAPYNEHLLHDVGAFQIGIGATLLLALLWNDALAVALAGFVVGGGAHTVSHIVDRRLGGHSFDPWALGALAVVGAIALVIRLRQLSRATR
jgi:hypothetical protein